MTKMINQNNRTDQCPPRPQRNGTGHHREWTASRPRLAAHSSGVDGLEYIEACCRVQDCCEPRTARGPVPVSRCALGCSLLLVLVALRPSAIADSGSPISSPASNTIPALVLTNALSDQTVLGFDKLAGYPLKLTGELQSNTNLVAWADSPCT